MTAEQNLIDRIDKLKLRTGFTLSTIRRSFGIIGWYYTTAGRCAARYVKLTGCKQREAAVIFGCVDSTVSQALVGIWHEERLAPPGPPPS